MVLDYLPPRVVFLSLGWRVAGGGGDKATPSQSCESRCGKATPGFLGGRSLCGDTGVGGTLSSSVASCDSPNDTEAIERMMSLESKSILDGPRKTH